MKNPFRKKALAPREVFIRTYLDSIAPGVVTVSYTHLDVYKRQVL